MNYHKARMSKQPIGEPPRTLARGEIVETRTKLRKAFASQKLTRGFNKARPVHMRKAAIRAAWLRVLGI